MTDDFSETLREYLLLMAAPLPQNTGKPHRWVMSGEWFTDVIHLTLPSGHPLFMPPRDVTEPFFVYGYPVEIRTGSGAPTLEVEE